MSDANSMRREAPPAFAWDEWYARVGGRSMQIDKVAEYLQQIHTEQQPRFTGAINPQHRSPESGKDHLGNDRYKEWARDFDGFATKIFPVVVRADAPPPADLPDATHSHAYPHINRLAARVTF